MGFNQQTIECYLLAWECYRELYPINNQKTRQLPKPDVDIRKEITNLYNSERLSRLSETTPAINPETLEKWLSSCAQAVRNLLYPKVVSADTPLKEDSSATLLDMMPDGESISLLTKAIEQEETASLQNYQTQLNQLLNSAIAALEPEARELLQVYYSKQLTQSEIAQQLNLSLSATKSRILRAKNLLRQEIENCCHLETTSDGQILDFYIKKTCTPLQEFKQRNLDCFCS